MATWFSKDFLCPDDRKPQWQGGGIYGLTEIWGEASIQVKNRGRTSKPKCVQNKLQKRDIESYCHSSQLFSTWLSLHIGVTYWLNPRIDMKKS